MISINYYYIISFIIGIIFCKLFLTKKSKIPMIEYIKNFEAYNIVIMFYMSKAYEIIYKDHILIYSIEATKIDDEQFQKAVESYVKLTLKMMGQNMIQEFLVFYGSEETLYFNLVEFFNDKYESDEIRKQSVESISNHNTQSDETEEVL